MASGSGVYLELSTIERQDCIVIEPILGRPQNGRPIVQVII